MMVSCLIAVVSSHQDGDTFRGAMKFAKCLRHTITSAWDPPMDTSVGVFLRGSDSHGLTSGPLLQKVNQSTVQQ